MVSPRCLSYDTRDTIRNLLNEGTYNIERTQAKSILLRFMRSSLRRLRVSLKLNFMKSCAASDVFTTTIMSLTNRLGLTRNQLRKTRQIMIRNDVRALYNEIRNKNKELNDMKKELKQAFDTNTVNKPYRC